MKSRSQIGKIVARGLELPAEIVANIPKITLLGSGNVRVENYKSLIEYESDIIRINTSDKLIRITGSCFNIKFVTDEMLEIEGNVTSINLE